jgi:hypothetical protein
MNRPYKTARRELFEQSKVVERSEALERFEPT